MAHAKYTGKYACNLFKFAGAVVPGIRKITITENGKPIAGMIDGTVSGDTAYVMVEDALGGKGSPSAKVAIDGFLSVTAAAEIGVTTLVKGATGTVLVTKAASGDEYTLLLAKLDNVIVSAPFAGVVAFTASFSNNNSSGTWLTDVP